jgi:hypothetical protein
MGEVSAGENFFNPSANTVDVTFGDDLDGVGCKADHARERVTLRTPYQRIGFRSGRGMKLGSFPTVKACS